MRATVVEVEGDAAILALRFDSLGEAAVDGGDRWPAAGDDGRTARVRFCARRRTGRGGEACGAGGVWASSFASLTTERGAAEWGHEATAAWALEHGYRRREKQDCKKVPGRFSAITDRSFSQFFSRNQ